MTVPPFCFLGKNESFPKLQQTRVEITPTSTMYQFEHKKINLTVTFTSPLLPDDPVLLSRPCSYIRIDGTLNSPANARVLFTLSSDIICETPGESSGGTCHTDTFKYAYMGKAFQHPLGSSGDMTQIDWGFLYLASRSGKVRYSCENSTLTADITLFDKDSTRSQASNILIAAYDDLLSIYYLGMWKKAYWTTRYSSILEAIDESFADYENVAEKCSAFDKKLETSAYNAGGNAHKFLCAISYRQIMAAHKLIEDENHNLIFLSKENSSNGCIGTADITYPSAPLFLLYNPELLKECCVPSFVLRNVPYGNLIMHLMMSADIRMPADRSTASLLLPAPGPCRHSMQFIRFSINSRPDAVYTITIIKCRQKNAETCSSLLPPYV